MTKQEEEVILGFDTSDPEQKEALTRHLRDQYLAGHSMAETLQIPEYQLEQLYSVAYQKYQAGEYQKASETFQYLLFLDDKCYKYLLGAAACFHKQEMWEVAIPTYQMAALQCPEDPVPLFHMADCYLRLGMPEKAAAALEMVVRMGTLNEKYAVLKERAKMIKETIESKGKKKRKNRKRKK